MKLFGRYDLELAAEFYKRKKNNWKDKSEKSLENSSPSSGKSILYTFRKHPENSKSLSKTFKK